MKALRYHLFLLGLLCLIGSLAWGQAPLSPINQAPAATLDFFSGVIGALVFMSLFSAAQFLLNRDAPHGWYAVYLTLTSVWLWQAIRSWFDIVPRLPDHAISLAFMLMLGYGMMVSYVRFISYLLEVPQQHPQLARWFRYFFAYLAVSLLTSLTGLFVWNSLLVYIATGVFSYLSMLIIMVQIVRLRHPLKRYVLTGTILLVSSAIISALLNFTGVASNDRLNRMPYFYVSVGTLLEVLCFSLALGRRFQLNKEEKIQAQHQLIGQLEENQRLQQTHTAELKYQLNQRTQEVQEQSYLLEAQHIRQLETEFERKLADTEMTALRAQMNPHFIFNCLNSIKLYTLQNDADKASDYLTKFSRLIRLVLENSRSEMVPLQNELEALQLYIELEAMRFKQKVQFTIHISPEIDQRFLCIPPLLLQPYVENAIWHGLMHKTEGGTVTVEVSQPKDNLLHIEITDDGVGRHRAVELKSKSAGKHKSFGMQVTADRIRMINQLYNIQTKTQIVDLVDSFGEACGTQVILHIPV